jgi:hypothetical protein
MPRYRKIAITIRLEDRVREKELVISQETKGTRSTERAVGMVLTLLPSAVVAVAAPWLLPLLYWTNKNKPELTLYLLWQ